MGLFDSARISKILNIVKVNKTLAAPNQKLGVTKVRAIQKVHDFISLPQHTALATYSHFGSLGFMYTVAMERDFSLLDYQKLAQMQIEQDPETGPVCGGALTVRWRVGTVSHRYFLIGRRYSSNLDPVNEFTVPAYAGETIKKNCVFEFWSLGTDGEEQFTGIGIDLLLKTSLLREPADGEAIVGNIVVGTLVTYAQMAKDIDVTEDFSVQASTNN